MSADTWVADPGAPFVVEDVIVEDESKVLLVALDGRTITMTLYAQCCSESYFDDDS